MKPGDLVVGRVIEQFGMKIAPLPGAIGLVLEVIDTIRSARVLYNERVYTYFLTELRVLNETDGTD